MRGRWGGRRLCFVSDHQVSENTYGVLELVRVHVPTRTTAAIVIKKSVTMFLAYGTKN
jgi:hypothetical protein